MAYSKRRGPSRSETSRLQRRRFGGRGLLFTATPALPLLALIHRSAWNRYSRKFISKILHTPAPKPLKSPSPGALFSPTPLERVMNLGENRIEMRITQSVWFSRDLCFPHS